MSAPPIKSLCCPECGSFHVLLYMVPGVSVRPKGWGSFQFVNRTYKRCSRCLHEWDRATHEGLICHSGTPPSPPKPGFWTRLFQRLCPHLN